MQDYQQPTQQPVNDPNGGNQPQYNPTMQNPQFMPYAPQQPGNYQNYQTNPNPQQQYNQNYQANPNPQQQYNQNYQDNPGSQPVNYPNDGNQMPYVNTQGNQYPNQQHPTSPADDQQGIDPNTVPAQQPVSVSTGSPESAPIPVAPEQSNQSVEYGYEKLKQLERASENLQQIENKETRNPQNDDQQAEKAKMPVAQIPSAKPQGPKIFGYHIPQAITTNITAIRERKGTGNPDDARTWIYVLLDKLLKRQTYQD